MVECMIKLYEELYVAITKIVEINQSYWSDEAMSNGDDLAVLYNKFVNYWLMMPTLATFL